MQEDPPQPDSEVAEPVPEEVDQPEPDNTAKAGRLDKHKHRLRRFKAWYANHKKWSIPTTILVLLIILAAVPFTRYNLAGLVLKKNYTVQITDATAHNPVSGVTVSSGSATAVTNADGVATLHLKVGSHNFSISKKYYQARQVGLVVPLLKEKQPDVTLVATGRQVSIKVTNFITSTPLSGVNISVAGTSAKTNASGDALLVLPAGQTRQYATLSLAGYNNNSNVTIYISNTTIKQNDFTLTPTGKIYFLSNASGPLNVMKANLDGSQPQVVVAATGDEDPSSTSLMQSADGKYVALVAKRTSTDPTAQIYVLAAADDKLLQIDSGDAIFTLYGWIGDSLIYGVSRQDLPSWQLGVGKLESYDATTGNTTLLDQTAGSDATTDINEIYNSVIISGDQVVYSKTWSGDQTMMSGKENTVQVIDADGQNHAVVASYDATTETQQLYPNSPVSFYIDVQQQSGAADTDYEYTVGSVPKSVTLTGDQLTANDNNYLFSPSGDQTFWSQMGDGQNTLLVGDENGANTTTVASLSAFTAYGWYTDNYLLVSQNNDQLYIMSVKGGNAVKVADYLASAPDY